MSYDELDNVLNGIPSTSDLCDAMDNAYETFRFGYNDSKKPYYPKKKRD